MVVGAFDSQRWLHFCHQAVSHLVQVSRYLQRTNGINERLTQMILNLMRRYLLAHGGKWFDCYQQMGALYHSLPHSVMRMSPECGMSGLDLRLFGTSKLLHLPLSLVSKLFLLLLLMLPLQTVVCMWTAMLR